MSDKLSSEHRRALEILLEPGIKELLKERSRKTVNRTKLKKWMEDGEPYEEIDEILEFPNKTRMNDVSSIKNGSAGTVRNNSDNERGKNYRDLSRLHSSKDRKTGKHCSSSGSTSNTTTSSTYESYKYSSKSPGRKCFPNSVKTRKQYAYSTESVEPSEQIYRENGGGEDQKL